MYCKKVTSEQNFDGCSRAEGKSVYKMQDYSRKLFFVFRSNTPTAETY
jgi:hypothetical protein